MHISRWSNEGVDPSAWERVLETKHEGATVAVVRDPEDGRLHLLPTVRERWLADLTRYEASGHERRHSTLLAGLLPRSAIRALALDSRGEWHEAEAAQGAWIVVVPTRMGDGDPALAFFGRSGRRVKRPMPRGYSRTPVPDANAPCPVCEGTDWNLASRPAEIGKGNERLAVCVRCGHFEKLPKIIELRVTRRGSHPTRAELEKAWLERVRVELPGLRQPAFGLAHAWQGRRGLLGYPRRNEDARSAISLVHGSLRSSSGPLVLVDTWLGHPRDPEILIDARWAFASFLATAQGDPADDEAVIERALAYRKRHALEATAPRRSKRISVAGKPIRFSIIGDDQLWAGLGRRGRVEIVLRARSVPPRDIELVPIEDFEPYMHVGRWL